MRFYIHTDIKTLCNFLSFCACWFGGCRLSDITQEEFDKVQNLYLRRVKENDKDLF